MSRISPRWVSIGLVLIILSLVIASPLNQSFARQALQTTPETGWEEGLPVNPEDNTNPATEWDEGLPLNGDAVPTNEVNSPAATAADTLYRTFSGTHFQPTSSSMTYNPIGGTVYATALPPGGYSFSFDLDLPSGATITEVVFYVIDNDAAANFGLSLRSYDPATNAFTVLESGASTGSSDALQTIVIAVDPPVEVNNTTTSYRLRVAPGVASSAHLLHGARIGYSIPTDYLPIIGK